MKENAWFTKFGSFTTSFPSEKPSVMLLMSEGTAERAKIIAAGCEEEGVPLCWDTVSGSAQESAAKACLMSRLEVGIGVDSNGCAVSLVKVPEKAYVTKTGMDDKALRWIGQAAGRLSKGEPLPDMH